MLKKKFRMKRRGEQKERKLKREKRESEKEREPLGASWHDMIRQICGSRKWNEITILPL